MRTTIGASRRSRACLTIAMITSATSRARNRIRTSLIRDRGLCDRVAMVVKQVRDLRDAPIVVRILEHFRNRLTFVFHRNETVVDVSAETALLPELPTVLHRAEPL